MTVVSNGASDARCHLQACDGYIIEAGQTGKKMLDLTEDFGG